MEEASKAKKAKKGFMTPERKKKLRLLLRKKAAEELKKEQERKAAERRRIIEERCGSPRNLSDASEGMFAQIHYNNYFSITKKKKSLQLHTHLLHTLHLLKNISIIQFFLHNFYRNFLNAKIFYTIFFFFWF